MMESIQFGSKTIQFSIERVHRKTLAISVHPDLRIVAKAPINAELDVIKLKIKKRSPWIIKQQVYFSDFLPKKLTKKYLSGESFWYLGKQYRLKVHQGDRTDVRLKGPFLWVSAKGSMDSKDIMKLLDGWYSQKAEAYLQSKIQQWWLKVSRTENALPRLIVKKMAKRWGSFTKQGRVILNSELIQAPSQCIEYVVIHELCHAFHQNHSRAFFRLLERVLPDWEKRKERLERFGC